MISDPFVLTFVLSFLAAFVHTIGYSCIAEKV